MTSVASAYVPGAVTPVGGCVVDVVAATLPVREATVVGAAMVVGVAMVVTGTVVAGAGRLVAVTDDVLGVVSSTRGWVGGAWASFEGPPPHPDTNAATTRGSAIRFTAAQAMRVPTDLHGPSLSGRALVGVPFSQRSRGGGQLMMTLSPARTFVPMVGLARSDGLAPGMKRSTWLPRRIIPMMMLRSFPTM